MLIDEHRADNKKTNNDNEDFSALGLKPQALEKEKEDKKKKDSFVQETSIKKVKSKPSSEKNKKKKKRRKRSISPISEERRISKRRLLKLAEESFSSLKAKDEVSAIGAEPINLAEPAIQQGPAQRGIVIREPLPL